MLKRGKVKGEPANKGSTGRMAVKLECVCVSVCLASDPASVMHITESTDYDSEEDEDTAAGNDSEENEARPAVKARKRSYDRVSCCFYCKKMIKMNMPRHLRRVHSQETEVAEVLVCKDKHRRMLGFMWLTCRGNFNHNCTVIEAGKGDVIIGRGMKKGTSMSLQDKIDAYLPCVYCCVFYTKQHLWRHVPNCHFKPSGDDMSTKNYVRRCLLMLQGAVKNKTLGVDPVFKKEIVDLMRSDEVTQTVLNDDLIVKYGKTLHQRLGRSKNRANDISQHMRQLARLMLRINAITESRQCKVSLSECLSGAYFDTVVEATLSLCTPCEPDQNRPLFNYPNIGLKLGHALAKCAELKKGNGIRNDDKTEIKEAETFLSLHKSDWRSSVSIMQCKKICPPKMTSAFTANASNSAASTVASSVAHTSTSTMSAATPSPASTTIATTSQSSSPLTNSDTDCVPNSVNSDVECDVTRGRKCRISDKRKWSDEELDCLQNAFQSHMLNGTEPGYAECKLVKNKYPSLYNRTVPQIKARFIYMQATQTS